jgi:hypothetical protein
MWMTGLVLLTVLAMQGASPAAGPQTASPRGTFGMQCRFDDGSKAMLVVTKQDNRWMMFHSVEGGSAMVYVDIAEDGRLTIEDESDTKELAAWRDAFADLKKQPLETIMAEDITSFLARKNAPPCGHKTFYWRGS